MCLGNCGRQQSTDKDDTPFREKERRDRKDFLENRDTGDENLEAHRKEHGANQPRISQQLPGFSEKAMVPDIEYEKELGKDHRVKTHGGGVFKVSRV